MGVAEHTPRLQYGNEGFVQACWRLPNFVQTTLVWQSTQADPVVVQAAHCGNHGAAATHGGIHGFIPGPPQALIQAPPGSGNAEAAATFKLIYYEQVLISINERFYWIFTKCALLRTKKHRAKISLDAIFIIN